MFVLCVSIIRDYFLLTLSYVNFKKIYLINCAMFTFAALIISVLHHCVGINIILCQLISKVIVSTLTELQHKMHYN